MNHSRLEGGCILCALKCLVRKIHDREVITAFVGIFVLILDVRHHGLVSDRTRGGAEIPPAPEMPAPEASVQLREVLEYLPGRLALDVLRDLGYGNLRGHGDEQMYVLFRYVPTDDLDAVLVADFSYQVAQADGNPSRQNRFSILRRPHQMVFEVEDGVRPAPVQLHADTVSFLERTA